MFLLIAAVILVAVLVAIDRVRRGPQPMQTPASDCEKKPPPNEFAVAGCDENSAAGKPAEHAKPAPPARP
jgi:hypothetical protein